MQKITSFFWLCSGADRAMLQKCPSESSKYAGIGATIFFTGLFAALSGGYALYTVFDNYWIASLFGLVWGLLIFNLDRYIVSSMRKEGKPSRELLMATPRLILAVIISLVIAKPLELKIFEKEIEPELIVMEQQALAKQETQIKLRYTPVMDSLKDEVAALKAELVAKARKRDELQQLAQEEADGTGGSKRRNLGPIYKVKKADADKAQLELSALTVQHEQRILVLENAVARNDSMMTSEMLALEKMKVDGPAARMEALSRVADQSSAIFWAHVFIILLFIAIETAPVFVKLISARGPYDNLLKTEEHKFTAQEIEEMAKTNADAKVRTAALAEHERLFVISKLDAELK